jgi:hypothetical protein
MRNFNPHITKRMREIETKKKKGEKRSGEERYD